MFFEMLCHLKTVVMSEVVLVFIYLHTNGIIFPSHAANPLKNNNLILAMTFR